MNILYRARTLTERDIMKCIVCRAQFTFCQTADLYVSKKREVEANIYSQMDAGIIDERTAWEKILKYESLLLFPGKEPKWSNGEPVCYVCYNKPGVARPLKKRRFCCCIC